jgi:hypothetical protein
VFISGNI